MRRRYRHFLPAAVSLGLAACAGLPSQQRHQPPTPTPAPTVVAPTPNTAPAAAAAVVPVKNVWDKLRDSFAMPDCDSDPEVLDWARKFTRNPTHFEQTLRTALPRLSYVQQVAAQYDVAGEFVLLPWVESRFRPVPPHHGRPAGMWQIMPITAAAMGLRVDRHYDGRLDLPAATHAVMKLLRRYQDEFGDWRVTDYAYNAGEFSVRGMIRRHGMPPALPAFPDWPVRWTTREHLTKLLAMACVVREPGRFHVSLPTLPDAQRLVKMPVTSSMPLAKAAEHAGMSVDALKHLNGAFRGNMIDADAADYLMLPSSHAQQYRQSPSTQPDQGTSDDPPTPMAQVSHTAGESAVPTTHTVRRGESLWQIAHSYSMTPDQLRHLNHLHGNTIHPGQLLHVGSFD